MAKGKAWPEMLHRRPGRRARGRFAQGLMGSVAIAVLACVGYLAWRNHVAFERALVSQAQGLLLTIARAEAQSLEEYIENVRGELEILSTNAAVRNGFRDSYRGASLERQSELEESYRDVRRLADAIYLIDARGRVLSCRPAGVCAAGEDLSRLPDISAACRARRACVSEIFEGRSSARAVALLQPVTEGTFFAGMVRAVIGLERIRALVGQISGNGSLYAFVLDGHGMLVSYPDAALTGRDFAAALHAKFPALDEGDLRRGALAMERGGEGMHIVPLPVGGLGPGATPTLVAFTPIRIGENRWSIAVAMDYRSISAPLHRNLRDNILFVAVVIAVLGALGVVVYRARRKHAEFIVSTRALNIINRQLHLEIEERRRLASSIRNSIRGRGERERQ